MSLLGHADADHPQTYFEELSVQIRGPESGTTGQTGADGATSSPWERSKAIPAPVCSLAVQASGQLDGPRSWAGEFGI